MLWEIIQKKNDRYNLLQTHSAQNSLVLKLNLGITGVALPSVFDNFSV